MELEAPAKVIWYLKSWFLNSNTKFRVDCSLVGLATFALLLSIVPHDGDVPLG